MAEEKKSGQQPQQRPQGQTKPVQPPPKPEKPGVWKTKAGDNYPDIRIEGKDERG